MKPTPRPHIGIDFDNTIVSYDALFHLCARERGLIPGDVPPSKLAVRGYLWSLPDGNTPWTKLQGEVYGLRMAEAVPCPGVMEFVRAACAAGHRISIVSHKLEYPALGPRVNLRKASWEWLEAQGFLGESGEGIERSRVFFESSREAKIARIGDQACSHFIDDLPEVFTSPTYPSSAEPMLYAPAGTASPGPYSVFRHWDEIREHILSNL